MYNRLFDHFPHFTGQALPPFPQGFVDESWRNDSCPHIRLELEPATVWLCIWIEHSDYRLREFPDSDLSIYTVTLEHSERAERETLLESDDWNVIARFLDSHYWDNGQWVPSNETCRNGTPFDSCECC